MKKIILITSLAFLAACSQNTTVPDIDTIDTTVGCEVSDLNGTPVCGIENTKAVVQVYADFQCSACQDSDKQFMPVFEELAQAGKIQLQYRQYPLSFHANAQGDAIAALCAHDQNKFYVYKHALYELERTRQGAPVTDKDRLSLAEKAGLNTETFTACVKDSATLKRVEADIALGDSLKVNATPTYLMNNKKITFTGITTIEQLKDYIEKLAESQE